MSHLPSIPLLQPTESIGKGAPSRETQQWRPHSAYIHILDEDSLLNIFGFCQPVHLEEDETDETGIKLSGTWERERWWYQLAHVCHDWRVLILGSPSRLRLCLLCTYGTPVTDMLEYSPPLPLIIDYNDISNTDDRELTAEDENGIQHALQHRHRVRRIRLAIPLPNLQKLIVAIDNAFPMLEYLYIQPPAKQHTGLTLPETLQAPLLRHLILDNIAFPLGSPLLTTAPAIVTLMLESITPSESAYVSPSQLLQRLSLMPQLENLGIGFRSPIPNRDIERQLLHAPIMTPVTLPRLRLFLFKGTSAYLEVLLPWITTPILQRLAIAFFNQLIFSVPHLLHFMTTTEDVEFNKARITFSAQGVEISLYPHEGSSVHAFNTNVTCKHLDWQVASAGQILNALGTIYSDVEDLTLVYWDSVKPLEWRYEAYRTQWRGLLTPFSKVKTLRVDHELIRMLSFFSAVGGWRIHAAVTRAERALI